MPFIKGQTPWNRGKKGYKLNRVSPISYYQKNKEKIIPNSIKNKRLKKEMLAGRKKSGFCEVCGMVGKICFDHDHKTGKFRGWICHRCNTILGYAKDNPAVLKALEQYLIKHYAIRVLSKKYNVIINKLGKVVDLKLVI